VSFVGSVFPTARLSDTHAPVLAVIAKILRSKYLHREIREKGGAYGGFALYNTEDGLFGFGSYRDPHIRQTLRAFEGACDFIRSGDYNEEDITEAVLQVCSDIDKPMPPGMEARKAFYRELIGLTDTARQEYKERLLDLRRANVLATAERFFGVSANARSVAVISSEEKLNAANADGSGRPFVLKKI
jgi:Zn-dependent M16 (insulinase) family peptidase